MLGRLACCAVFGLVAFGLAMELFVAFASARHSAYNGTCGRNTRDLAQALLQYAQDWDETLPPSAHWADAAAMHVKAADVGRTFHCPEVGSGFSYVYNVHLNRSKLAGVGEPSSTPMVYEGNGGSFNSAGDGFAVPVLSRHMGGSQIGYADGHTKRINSSVVHDLNWQNKPAPRTETSKP